jgi:hypothetical protein
MDSGGGRGREGGPPSPPLLRSRSRPTQIPRSRSRPTRILRSRSRLTRILRSWSRPTRILRSRSRPTRIHVRVAVAIVRPGRPLAGVAGREGGRCGDSICRKLFLHTRGPAPRPHDPKPALEGSKGEGGQAVTVTTGRRDCRGYPLIRICEIRVMCGPHGCAQATAAPRGPGSESRVPRGP